MKFRNVLPRALPILLIWVAAPMPLLDHGDPAAVDLVLLQ